MFQGIRELRAAKGRTAIITVTVTLITMLVSLLSALTSGLSFQSVSALQARLSDSEALILEDNGSSSLSTSRLSDAQQAQIEAAGGEVLLMARARMEAEPIIIFSDASLAADTAVVPASLAGDITTVFADARVERTEDEGFFDHLPVVTASADLVEGLPGVSAAGILSAEQLDELPEGAKALEGSARWNASASYAGEQLSLNLMIYLLYVISALVLGAFFTVWTMQRLRGVAISAALGTSRRVLIADSVGQAFVVLAVGILAGTAITLAMGQLAPANVPMIMSASTLAWPALILMLAGLLGAAISIRPVLSVEPRSALAAA